MPPRKKTTGTNDTKTRATKSSSQGSLTFLVLVLIILGIIVAILAFKEPLTRMVVKNPAGTPVPTSSASTPALPSPSPAGTPAQAAPTVTPTQEPTVPPANREPTANPGKSPEPMTTRKETGTITVDGGNDKTRPASSKPPKASAKPAPVNQVKNLPTTPPKPRKELGTASLFMVRVTEDGNLELDQVRRKLDFGDSPLLTSINALLKGPTSEEMNSGLVSMIPQGTRLISAWVNNGTAFLNFSENFMFNPLGSSGLHAQLKQVLFAATEFPTVQQVQILIEGKKTDYLGGDNVYIGAPLTRKNLK